MVGTPGIGEGSFAAYHCKCRRKKQLVGTVWFDKSEAQKALNIEEERSENVTNLTTNVTQALEMRG
jgi:hypothetical protein